MFSVYTKSGSVYTFDVYMSTIRVMVHGSRELVVNSISNLKEGGNMCIEGFFVDSNGEISDRLTITTSPILKILRDEEMK